ncbi:MAG TPA: SCO family protein [Rhodospirillaceae bacterium]|nr:SCO family protein [Candidatus Neomarinimicrobiota bacterium]HCX14909.1 SCO family protein [Rhodospirillaceae bacterium]
MAKRILIAALILLSTLAVLLMYLPVMRPAPQSVPLQTNKVQIGGPFSLVNTRGERVTESILKGHYSLVYFGFTYCPDICSLALQTITDAISGLELNSTVVLPVFISLDPERDTAEVVAGYIENFHPDFIGLTGTIVQIKTVAEQYRVYAKKSFFKDVDGNETNNYTIDHTGFIYLMDPNGLYVDHFADGVTTPEITERLKKILARS